VSLNLNKAKGVIMGKALETLNKLMAQRRDLDKMITEAEKTVIQAARAVKTVKTLAEKNAAKKEAAKKEAADK